MEQEQNNINKEPNTQTDLEFKVGSYYKLILNKSCLTESYDIKKKFGKRADYENEVFYIIGRLDYLPETIPSILMYSSVQPSPKILHKYSEMKKYSETSINLTLADGKQYYFPICSGKGWMYSNAVDTIVEASYEDYNKSCVQFSKNKDFGANALNLQILRYVV
jgi:hypothetical protein